VESEEADVYEIDADAPEPAEEAVPATGRSVFGSIIDGDTLRDLNNLLSSLKVGGTDSHE
jgi:hypothetical protein